MERFVRFFSRSALVLTGGIIDSEIKVFWSVSRPGRAEGSPSSASSGESINPTWDLSQFLWWNTEHWLEPTTNPRPSCLRSAIIGRYWPTTMNPLGSRDDRRLLNGQRRIPHPHQPLSLERICNQPGSMNCAAQRRIKGVLGTPGSEAPAKHPESKIKHPSEQGKGLHDVAS